MKRVMWLAAVGVGAIFLATSGAMAQEVEDSKISAELRQDIRKLMELNGDIKIGEQLVAQIINSVRAKLPGVPLDTWQRIMQKIDTTGMIEPVMEIYATHFTPEEIKGLMEFYESPVGKKFMASRPAFQTAILKDSQEWRIAKVKEIEQLFQAETHAAQPESGQTQPGE